MPYIKHALSQTFLLITVLALGLGLISCNSVNDQAAKGETTDTQFESKVLEIIRKRPEVVLEALQAYEQKQRQEQTDLRKKVLGQLQAQPKLIIRDSPVMGATNQKIVIAEFSDFQCPYCSKAQVGLKQFMAKHKDEVTLVFKHFPLTQIHPEALPAALAAWAAGQQGKFWEYHNALFDQQEQLGEKLYTSTATNLNLDMDKFNKDRNSEAAKAAIKKDVELGKSLGLPGTPFFVVNGMPLNNSGNLVSDLESALVEVQAKSK